MWGACASDVRQQHDWIKPALSIKSDACAIDFKKHKISIKWIFNVYFHTFLEHEMEKVTEVVLGN